MESDDSQTVVPKNTPSAQDPLADVDSRLSKACMKIMADIRDENGFLVRSHDFKTYFPKVKTFNCSRRSLLQLLPALLSATMQLRGKLNISFPT
jgi:hypothetical protein